MKPKLASKELRRISPFMRLNPAVLTLSLTAIAQTPSPSFHHVSAIHSTAEGSVLLRLTGTPSVPLQRLYDLFPIEASANLIDWQPLATVLRTNVTNEVVFADADAKNLPARFYRTSTNHFATAFLSPTGPYPVGTF
jgi:hypothetical protein